MSDLMHLEIFVTKRDGKKVPFDATRIERAIFRCLAASAEDIDGVKFQDVLGSGPIPSISDLVNNVTRLIKRKANGTLKEISVEQIQDHVETVLILNNLADAAKHYILYRAERAKLRESYPIPEEIRFACQESSNYFPTPLQEFQFLDKNARWSTVKGRRETFPEAVKRSVNYLNELASYRLPSEILRDIEDYMLRMEVWPSMRLFSMAGPSARRNNVGIYNCSYAPVVDIQSFVETLLISMGGCGVGYSVEQVYVEKLPRVLRQKNGPKATHLIEDTTEGWGEALRIGLEAWFNGDDVVFGYEALRPAGAILKTKGGRASGPEPLRELLWFVRGKILSRQGTVLRPIDVHHIQTKIGGAAVSGGMRRTSMIAIFDHDDNEVRRCKMGDLTSQGNSHLWNANISSAWPIEGMREIDIIRQMSEMYDGECGEPGIFSRFAAYKTAPPRRVIDRWGTNPCGEILLRPWQFCNLSIVVARPKDTYEDLRFKVYLATIIGTIQASATNFPGLRKEWSENCREEALLGVDINGQMDCPAARDPENLRRLRDDARLVNKQFSEMLGINESAAITCVKPSGNSSVLFNCSPGIHALWAPYFIRRTRVARYSPMFTLLRDAGVPIFPENGQTWDNFTTAVVEWPCKAPDKAITKKDLSALSQLEYWKMVKLNWTEHNPSCTIYYKANETADVLQWVVKNQDVIGGLTFLPDDGGTYQQPPFSEISQKEYDKRVAEFPAIDFSKLWRLEHEDWTTSAQELACFGGSCEVL